MAVRDERVARLEVHVQEHTQTFTAVRESLAHLELRFESRLTGLEQRVDTRFASVDRRLDTLDRRFFWMLGLQITVLAAVVGGLLSR